MGKIFLVLFFLLGSMTNSSANETITLAIGEWAPYTSEKNQKGKIAEVLVTEAFKLVGIGVKFQYFPWKRSYVSAQKGVLTGTFPWLKTDKRASEIIYTKEPLIESRYVFFHMKSLNFKWESDEDLKKYNFGGTIGYKEIEFLESRGIKVQKVVKEEFNLKKMLVGRIDVAPFDFLVGYHTINTLFPPAQAALFTNHPRDIFGAGAENMYLLISKNITNGQEIADKFDTGLRKLKESGRYDTIIAQYFGK